ncbi:DNA translocase FtsK [Neisseria sp.]|uniref:DNA translocase FtsK n=1 Tax=Neisseria sp. TaxID=192066 RepID=UPI0035A13FDA
MEFLIILLLLGVIGGVLWLRSRDEEAWTREMQRINQPRTQLELLVEEDVRTETTSDTQSEEAREKTLTEKVYDDISARVGWLVRQFTEKPELEENARDAAYVDASSPYKRKTESEQAASIYDLQTAPEDDGWAEVPEGGSLQMFGAEAKPAAKPRIRARVARAVPEIVPFEEMEEPEYRSAKVVDASLPVITLEEATRALHESQLEAWAAAAERQAAKAEESETAPRPKPDASLPTIEADDPALRRTRNRLLENVQHAVQNVPQPPKKEEPEYKPSESAVREEIGFEDIHANLLGRRTVRRKKAEAQVPPPEPKVLRREEVFSNLFQSDAPAVRRPFHRIDAAMQDSVIPEAARVEQGAAKVKPKPVVQAAKPPAPFAHAAPAHTAAFETAGSSAVEAVFIAHPAAPTATVVEPPQMPPVQARPIDIPEPPVFRGGLEPVSGAEAYVDGNRHWSIADRLTQKSADAEQESRPSENPQSLVQTASNIQSARQTETKAGEVHAEKPAGVSAPATRLPEFLDDAHLPTTALLLPPEFNPAAQQTDEALLENSITIEEKLAEFRVKVKVMDAYAGPVITRYEIEPDVGVRGNAVLNLEKDLARSLGVASIRVVETIPGKTCMGLELPNPRRQMIRLSEIFNAPAFRESKSKLTLALGHDITGQPVVTDLAKAPHLLVAGTTGSGKSVGVNAMILSMLFKATPDDVRMIMIDPKMLELSIYEGIPHLLAPVVTDMKLAANALNWCVNEMEKRYRLMSHLGVRNLEGYNQKIKEAVAHGSKIPNPFSLSPDDPEPLEKLPFIVVVVDEFADLMMTAGKKIEELIARLAQKARAAGIHLILATQRPSVDVITGLIKANIPTRIAFQVSSKIDSRTILDQMGAENLLGQGDMLFLPPGSGYPQRVHGAFASDGEVHRVVEYLKQFGAPDYIDDILAGAGGDDAAGYGSGNGGEVDEMYDEAVAAVISTGKASISNLQRHLRIGYNRAATLIDQMEADGIVSAPETNGKRMVLARGGSHLD